MNEHPENIAIPPSTDGFWFCAWDAVDGDIEQYRQVRAGLIPCPIADACPTRAAHLALIAQRKTSAIWSTLTRREKKRIRNLAQGLLFEAEQQLGAHIVDPVVKAWLENEVGALIGMRMRKLLEPLTAQATGGRHISTQDRAAFTFVTQREALASPIWLACLQDRQMGETESPPFFVGYALS